MSRIVSQTMFIVSILLISTSSFAQQINVQGSITQIVMSADSIQDTAIDFKNARPMPLPQLSAAPSSLMDSLLYAPPRFPGKPGFERGGSGDGKQRPVQLVAARDLNQSGVEPQEFGTSNQPFTTNRVNAYGDNTQYYYPFCPAGKLFFNIGSATYVCSASLIKPGVVVTAAHCVANFGQQQFYANWVFVPAYSNGTAPYGVWSAASATVMTSYYNGTDPCAVRGIVCQDDVAVLGLAPQAGSYAGNRSGWYGYGWNGYGFNSSGLALINQLGYPVALDGGGLMQRNDSQGFVASGSSNNTIIGSLMTGGSSGGPWHVNLGMAPALDGTNFGSASARNTVVGVTSWGYTATSVKQQGASPFSSGNIVSLINAACTRSPAAC
ncbi:MULTISPECIES: serine protease [Burkholderia]|uniref:V8-like Glu-specific endopeptidase n=1 Tax=Burkholderia pyrrocinia TaxID=60550 RepID=A0A318HSC0_BURPY|nr:MULTISPECIES: trypsin-like serine protease [Burkholderia]PXX21033.1 V8-like Glu-specific endopeptidase [Burkholderia pyrrocinia]SFW91108.1 V8-like Glu-specific endopeptidase [Burkholderia sp. NFACC33-1]SFY46544.1 V8-like Glu-specific endopeptidase [Burkholderia sp. NFPP32]